MSSVETFERLTVNSAWESIPSTAVTLLMLSVGVSFARIVVETVLAPSEMVAPVALVGLVIDTL